MVPSFDVLFHSLQRFRSQNHENQSTPTPEQKIEMNQESLKQTNILSAALLGVISRVLIERNLFQNSKIPLDALFYLANDLIRTISPSQRTDTISVPKELSLLWKQLRNKPLSVEDQTYLDRPKRIDVAKEVFNGLKYSSMALMGQGFYHSVTTAVTGQLWSHVPAICGYFSVAIGGHQALAYAVAQILQKTVLTQEQQSLVEPWLNMVGRLALGLTPKVHATEQGVHYQYPSLEGHSQTISGDQTVTLRGDTLLIERVEQIHTANGSFEGVYESDFKLGQFYELTEERIRIEVIDKNGASVPVVFTKILGQYGAEIAVSCANKALEQYWSHYLRPAQITTSQPTIIQKIGLQENSNLALNSVKAAGYKAHSLAIPAFCLMTDLMVRATSGSSSFTPALSALIILSLPKIITAEQMIDEIPVGFVMAYASPSEAPKEMGYLKCDGTPYLKSEYEELYAVLCGKCGEDSKSFPDLCEQCECEKDKFCVPNYQNLFLRGVKYLKDIGKYSNHTTSMSQKPFQMHESGSHTHTVSSSGMHDHKSDSAGEHGHRLDPAGEHAHTVSSNGDHKHTVHETGEHTHVINEDNDLHTHQIHYAGQHNHNNDLYDLLLKRSAGTSSTVSALDDIGANEPDIVNSGTIQAAGSHLHTMDSAGKHRHTMESSGNHIHEMDQQGKHEHTLNTAAPHIHEMSVEGLHCHTISSEGLHTHEITESGKHTHKISGGDAETSPENRGVIYWIKAKSTRMSACRENSTPDIEKQIQILEDRIKTLESYQYIIPATTTLAAFGCFYWLKAKIDNMQSNLRSKH